MSTYQSLKENEERYIELKLYDKDNLSFSPSAASMSIYNTEDELIESPTCTITNNIIKGKITVLTTSLPGIYHIIWTIQKNGNIYKHKTILQVFEL